MEELKWSPWSASVRWPLMPPVHRGLPLVRADRAISRDELIPNDSILDNLKHLFFRLMRWISSGGPEHGLAIRGPAVRQNAGCSQNAYKMRPSHKTHARRERTTSHQARPSNPGAHRGTDDESSSDKCTVCIICCRAVSLVDTMGRSVRTF